MRLGRRHVALPTTMGRLNQRQTQMTPLCRTRSYTRVKTPTRVLIDLQFQDVLEVFLNPILTQVSSVEGLADGNTVLLYDRKAARLEIHPSCS